MKFFLSVVVIALVAGVLFSQASVALAQEPPVRITTNTPLQLLVDGLETADEHVKDGLRWAFSESA